MAIIIYNVLIMERPISHNLSDSEHQQRQRCRRRRRRRRTKEQHVAIFPPARFSQLRVQCFFLALKKGSNNLAPGSIFCSPSIFYWGHRQFLSTCSIAAPAPCTMYYILSTSYVLGTSYNRDRKSYHQKNQPTLAWNY